MTAGFRVIRPAEIADADLTATNIYDVTSHGAYNAGTTYALGDSVYTGTVGGVLQVYVSLQNSNTGNTPASSPSFWEKANTTYAAWDSGATYALGDRVLIDATHKVYESLQAGNTNKAPATETAWWVEVGATQAWRMFDLSPGAQTTRPDSIEVSVVGSGRNNVVALLNIDAATAQLTIVSGADSYDSGVINLVSDSGIGDWWSYFFEPIVRQADLILPDLPPINDATYTIELLDAGGNPSIGELVIGLGVQIGHTQYGATVGIRDYSRKETDDFGNTYVTERAFAKTGSFSVQIYTNYVDQLQRDLAALRATPTLYYAADGFYSTAIYGFYKDFRIDISGPEISDCVLEVEALA